MIQSEDKNNTTIGTVGAHVEDNTTNEDTTAPSGEANLGVRISETNQTTSPTSHTVEQILGAHPTNDDFWKNTNSTDVSIDTVNSVEKLVGSYITEFHTPKDKEITPEDTLCQESEHSNNDHEHQNTRDSTYNPSADDELVTHKDELISSVAMQDQDHANIM